MELLLSTEKKPESAKPVMGDDFPAALGNFLSGILSVSVDAYEIHAPLAPVTTLHGNRMDLDIDLSMAFLLFNAFLGGRVDDTATRRRKLTAMEESLVKAALDPLLATDMTAAVGSPLQATLIVTAMEVDGRMGIRASAAALDAIAMAVMARTRRPDGESVQAASRLLRLLYRADVKLLTTLVLEEHPQTASVLLAFADHAVAGNVLLSLIPSIQADLVSRLVFARPFDPRALTALADFLEARFPQAGKNAEPVEFGGPVRGSTALHRILDAMGMARRCVFLESIREYRPETADAVERG